MRIECPECEASIRIAELPEDGKRIKCTSCGHKFKAPDPEDEEDEEDEEEERPKSKKKRRDEDDEKKFPIVPVAAGVGGILVVLGVLLAIVFTSKSDKKNETVSNDPPKGLVTPPTNPPTNPPVTPPTTPNTNVPPKKEPPKQEPPVNPPPPKGNIEVVNSPYASLFQAPATAPPPPSVRGATLTPANLDVEPEIPTFYSLMMARKVKGPNTPTVVPKTAKLNVEELKKAAAYIKVESSEGSSTGSGFLISTNGNVGLVATNHHVIDAALKPRYGTPAKVSVVFNSGTADEQILKADILAYDPLADLAILKVVSQQQWPKILNPYNTPPKLQEGIPITFWGFPLGAILAGGKKNPEITVGTATLAGFQHGDGGKLERLKIGGTMNPGNSGGPIVDADGRLVGIAVAIVNPAIGTGIGFAVPVNDLIALLEGKMLSSLFISDGIEKDKAKFLAVAPMMDPLNRIETIFIRRWAGDGRPPEIVKDPNTGFKPFGMRADGKANLPGAEEFPLQRATLEKSDGSSLEIALGELTVPLDTNKILIQVASQTIANPQTGYKYTAASKPIEYTMTVADLPMGTDARPFAELAKNPDQLAGRTLVVKARIMAPPITREPIQDLIIADVTGQLPDRMKFLVSRELATQFDEVEREQQPMPVRLACLVGQRLSNGTLPVRVLRVDFIGRGNRIVRTIPAAPASSEKDLSDLNRDPERFAGKTVNFKSMASPITSKFKTSNEFLVLFEGLQPPRNVSFTINEAQKIRLIEKLGDNIRLNMVIRVRVTGSVPDKVGAVGGKTIIPISKIELLGRDGNVVSTVE